jgi:hypothetical protein
MNINHVLALNAPSFRELPLSSSPATRPSASLGSVVAGCVPPSTHRWISSDFVFGVAQCLQDTYPAARPSAPSAVIAWVMAEIYCTAVLTLSGSVITGCSTAGVALTGSAISSSTLALPGWSIGLASDAWSVRTTGMRPGLDDLRAGCHASPREGSQHKSSSSYAVENWLDWSNDRVRDSQSDKYDSPSRVNLLPIPLERSR